VIKLTSFTTHKAPYIKSKGLYTVMEKYLMKDIMLKNWSGWFNIFIL